MNNSYNIPRNIRGNNDDVMIETIQIIRNLIFYYNENIANHARIMETYNSNISNIINLLNHIIDENVSRRHRTNDYRETNIWQNLFQRRREPSTPRNSYDLSNLVYLLNIPIQTTTNTETRPTLTQRQINDATQLIYYNETMGERRCPISLDDFLPNEEICQIRGCHHIFKTSHLLRWFETHIDCPVCRYDLRQYRPAASLNRTNRSEERVIPNTDISSNTTVIPENPPDVIQENVTETPNINSERNSEATTTIPRNVSLSEFLPILENILSPPTTNRSVLSGSPAGLRRNESNTRFSNSNLFSETNIEDNILNSRFSQVLSDIILEQMPSVDSSNNLLYTIEIPLLR
jgi:Ring finger domain